MDKYLIVIEYSLPEIDYVKKIIDYLKLKGTCLQLTDHSFLLASENTAAELRDYIKVFEEGIQRVFVSKVTPPAAWFSSLSDSLSIKALFHE